MPLSAKTVKDRTIKMAEDITRQQIKDINSAVAYSVACDESKDKGDIEQIALFCRYVNSAGPQEEIIELIPLKGQTRGEDICEAVLNCLRAKGINTTHLVSVATDGAPSMTGAQKGFVALLQKTLDRKLLTFHCILHQEALCAQTFAPECTELHNKVRWLSRGEVLKRFAACLEEVKTFLGSKGLTFPELEQPEWLEKLHFMVDMTAHLNTLNTALQGKGRTALHMLEEVLAFERKLTVLARDLQKGVSQPDLEMELADIADKDIWVSKFKRSTADLEDVARQKAVLAQNHKWRDIENLPKTDQLVFETWNAIPDVYVNMKTYALGVLSTFGSTYVCEQVFSKMNFIKSKHRARLTDDSLRSCVKMKVTAYSPDVQTLCAEVQEQKSH
ncbi:hypothetical protein UPYG_G00173530 [Umbra pygmaea]|uniref:DUF4371 domain-containing protein n=1 Tax=Umbra pygmaea TaxID=75934 RepID=A0ABD0WU35_UMBPY